MLRATVGEFELPEDAKLGEEFLLRVRLVELREETVDVTSFGSPEPQLLSSDKSGVVIWVATRAIDRL